ncbi:MAG: hypothetical protein IJT19_09865 [Bacteroidaceae bacterium]|nr:hypothetical protein [Bacteroidaceae bacterium]
MKKTIFLSLMFSLLSLSTMAMSNSKVRTHARFLTDRMAYELDFTPMQYDDCYEINYDFIRQVSYLMDDVVYGYYDAIDAYYRYLDWRNDDLRYIMTASQYIRFMARDYFYRPIYTTSGHWYFRIYTTYSNRSFFYFDAPTVFRDYRGGHGRSFFSTGYYVNRYQPTDRFTGPGAIIGSQNFTTSRRSDFGSNLRNRDQKPDYNNYSNRNSSNRTADPRYRDDSGNRNTPQINSRTTGVEHRGASTGTSSRSSATATGSRTTTTNRSTAQPTTSSRSSQPANSGTRSGSGETRGNRSTTGR